ncbi:MAG: hypothetical protein A3H49_07825 [Nitrospirae bacterium RIFCSPLOWO2_02_FULL_62_14]|nr:MAG: hypothetical protein A3H49_07825 [Nitrospirae bacterium RIFCSPLOWO2_02_FULL_62_14]
MRAKKALAAGKGRVPAERSLPCRFGVGGCDGARGGRVRKSAQWGINHATLFLGSGAGTDRW